MRKIKCPHCGSEEGLEHKISMKGCDLYIGNGELEDEIIIEYDYRKTMICRNCKKRVMSFEEFLENHNRKDEL